MSDHAPATCPQPDLERLTRILDQDAAEGLRVLETLLATYPADARLHFLQGSALASARDYGGGEAAFARAVGLAPGFALARFQLGLLRLTQGDAAAAAQAWQGLQTLPADDALRLFAEGLDLMAQDRFEPARARLRDGLQRNVENQALNADMELVLSEIERVIDDPGTSSTSSAQWLLQQDAARRTRH